MTKCLTSAENTQTSLATYIAQFPSLGDYLLAFMMNLTGNILAMYNVFQSIMTASAICDYSSIANNMGKLFMRIYSVNPIEAQGLYIQDIDLEKSQIYQWANGLYLGLAAFIKEQGQLA